MSEVDSNLLFQAVGIEKGFNGIPVLKKVDLDIHPGEVHALMGENGAGKSTLIKIMTGVYSKDGGQIYMHGQPIEINSRQDAMDHGISVIYQELSVVPALSVAQNIFLGQEIRRLGIFPDRKASNSRIQELINRHNFGLDPNAPVESLSMAKRQMVEILKALAVKAKLIIMDEPTASLSQSEAETLYEIINTVRTNGASVLYISHRLSEVYRLADRLTILRDGQNVGMLEKDEINPKTAVSMMIGKELDDKDGGRVHPERFESNVLEVKGLAYKKLLKDINFKAYGGEVLGIGGLVGSGRTELISCIYGRMKQRSGTITLNGRPVSKSMGKNIRRGFALVPEDRRNEGFVPGLSIERNLAFTNYDKLSTVGLVSRRDETKWAVSSIQNYDIRPAVKQMPVSNLSGGNQQKVVFGRALARNPKILLLDEPTAGIDVGVKDELYRLMRELADAGAIVIMVSSDIAELVHQTDRILVIHDGCFFEEFVHGTVSQQAVLLAASGVHTMEGKML